MYAAAWLGCCQARKGGKALMLHFCICESKWILLFFVNKIMHNFQIGFDFVQHFLNQTYIFAVFNDETSKVILFKKKKSFYVQQHMARYAEI